MCCTSCWNSQHFSRTNILKQELFQRILTSLCWVYNLYDRRVYIYIDIRRITQVAKPTFESFIESIVYVGKGLAGTLFYFGKWNATLCLPRSFLGIDQRQILCAFRTANCFANKQNWPRLDKVSTDSTYLNGNVKLTRALVHCELYYFAKLYPRLYVDLLWKFLSLLLLLLFPFD